ncbi:MAG: four helix bundle protein, partial [Kiritimatiellae bacterium]|nr:four helix bundle protein [Kiritimatiellia bacterium]
MGKIRASGGYRELRSFQISTVIYDATYWFCEAFLDPRSRTVGQMVQAARSGRQNIAEGSRAAATSSQTELRLVNVARSSLEELLLDYEDFLRHRRLPQWHPDAAEALAVRNIGRHHSVDDRSDPSDPSNPSPQAL